MSLKNTGLGHAPKSKQNLTFRPRPLAFDNDIGTVSGPVREFAPPITLCSGTGTVQVVRSSRDTTCNGLTAGTSEPRSQPGSPATLWQPLTSSFRDTGESGTAVASAVPASSVFMATISDRDTWVPDEPPRGHFLSADLSALTGIHTTKRAFLPNFQYLQRVDLTPLSSLVAVGDYFMSDCSALETVDFSPLKDIKSIGVGFLIRCSLLHQIELGVFVKCQSLGSDFLSHCGNLTEVDFSGLISLTSVGDGFMQSCSSIREVTFSQPSSSTAKAEPNRQLATTSCNIRHIGKSFLANCTRLVTFDLTGFSKLKVIPSHFLSGCTALRQVNLSSLTSVSSVENYFLWGCSALLSVDFSKWSKLESVGSYFLSGCTSLGTADLSRLKRLTRVGSGFLSGCKYLHTIIFRGMPPLTEAGSHFLAGCSSLADVDLHILSRLESIDDCFLFGCRSLVHVDTAHLSRVQHVGHFFLSGCSGLPHIDFRPMAAHFRTAESFFLSDCTGLISLDLTQVPRLYVVGGGMLDGCHQLRVLHAASMQQLGGLEKKLLAALQVDVVVAGSPEAEKALAAPSEQDSENRRRKLGAEKCILCIGRAEGSTPEGSHDRFSDDHTAGIANTMDQSVNTLVVQAAPAAASSSRTSQSTSSVSIAHEQQPHGSERAKMMMRCEARQRGLDSFSLELVGYQQSRIWSLERQAAKLRNELETVTRRLGAFTSTVEKDMLEANQLLAMQKARINALEAENAELRRANLVVVTGQADKATPQLLHVGSSVEAAAASEPSPGKPSRATKQDQPLFMPNKTTETLQSVRDVIKNDSVTTKSCISGSPSTASTHEAPESAEPSLSSAQPLAVAAAPVAALERPSLSLQTEIPREEEAAEKAGGPTLAPRGSRRSSSVGAWLASWFTRDAAGNGDHQKEPNQRDEQPVRSEAKPKIKASRPAPINTTFS